MPVAIYLGMHACRLLPNDGATSVTVMVGIVDGRDCATLESTICCVLAYIMQQLLPIENPRGMAGLAKQRFAGSYREFDTDLPTDRSRVPTPPAQHVAATSCTVLMTVGCWYPQHTSVLTCRLLKRKPSQQCAWPLPQLSAIPSTASHTQSASANGVEQE